MQSMKPIKIKMSNITENRFGRVSPRRVVGLEYGWKVDGPQRPPGITTAPFDFPGG